MAAGKGTRLKPITITKPKCLVEICGRPLLHWWIQLFEQHNIMQVLINVHHFSEQIISFIENYKTDVKFSIYHEEYLLGSAGTLRENRKFVSSEEEFFIFNADNLTNIDLTKFLKFHKNWGQIFSMSLFRTAIPENCGIVLMDKRNIIIDFEEKPKASRSNLANAGIYIAKPEILELVPSSNNLTDIGFHLLPKLVGKMSGWETKDYVIDVGTLDNLLKAEREWSLIKKGVL